MTYQNGDKYPYTDQDLRTENPTVSFPKVLTDELRAEYGMTPVAVPDQPEEKPGKRYRLSDTPVDGVLEWIECDIPLEERMSEAQRECKRRILAVASTTKQLNMAAAVAAGLLDDTGKGLYTQGLLWIASMRQTWHNLAEQGADVYDDANWPECPEAVIEFANNF